MGRSVHEHHVGLSREQEDELALGAVADEAGVSLESLRANLRRLERLCPPLVARRERGEVKPARLARLALDLDAVASSMMRLKVLLPNTDVAEMCARKPALLGAEAVDRAVAVAAIVGAEYPRRFVVPGGKESEEKAIDAETSTLETRALLASVPDILLEPRDENVVRIVTRARAPFPLARRRRRAAGREEAFVSVDERRGARRRAGGPRRRPRGWAHVRGKRARKTYYEEGIVDARIGNRSDEAHGSIDHGGGRRSVRIRRRVLLVRALARRRLRARGAEAHAEGL